MTHRALAFLAISFFVLPIGCSAASHSSEANPQVRDSKSLQPNDYASKVEAAVLRANGMKLDAAVLDRIRSGSGASEIGEDDTASYLNPTVSIPSENSEIQRISRELVLKADSNEEKIYRIHNFVGFYLRPTSDLTASEHQNYLERCKKDLYDCVWIGALSSLKSGIGHCGTYSNLGAALLRAAGIPARTVQMTAALRVISKQKTGGDLFHQWNQVFVKGEWLEMDSTYDANLVKGSESTDYFLFRPNQAPKGDWVHSDFEIQPADLYPIP